MRPWIPLLCSALTATALLTGCGKQPDTTATRTPTAAPATQTSTTQTPATPATPTPPPLPEAATHNDEAGQLAFIQHWWDLYNYAYDTGDTGPLMAISQADQAGNISIKERAERIYSSGRRVEGGHYRITETVRVPLDEYETTAPTVTVERAPGAIISANGSREPLEVEPPTTMGMILVWKDHRWIMFGLGTI